MASASSSGHHVGGVGGAAAPTGSQSDTSLWLHNKLGTSNDSWTGGSIVSQLNPEILVKIQKCFQDLQPQVKLKLLLSLFHIPKRNLEAWRKELEDILDVAKEDSEPWVCMMAELLNTYPSTGQLNSDVQVPDTNRKIFTDLGADLKKVLKKSIQSDTVLPLECHFLNKNAFISVVGHQPQNVKHFALKRKPKAAALRADLIQKSQEAANKIKSSSSGSFPIRKSTMPRKMTADAAMSLKNRALSAGFKSSQRPGLPSRGNMRKPEGGVKLLDITEQPIGYAAAKKRKKQQEMEEQQAKKEKAAEEKEAAKAAAAAAKATPDYAAGLSNLNPPTPAPPTVAEPPSYAPATPSQAPATPAYAPQPSSLPTNSNQQPSSGLQMAQAPALSQSNALHPQQVQAQSHLAQQSASAIRNPSTFPASLTSLEPLPPTAVNSSIGGSQHPPPYGAIPPSGTGLPGQQVSQTVLSQPTLQTQQQMTRGPRLVQLPTQPIPQAQTPRYAVPTAVRPVGPVGVSNLLAQQVPQPQTPVQQQAAQGARIIRTVRPVSLPTQPAPTPQLTAPTAPQPQTQTPQQMTAAGAAQRRALTLTKEQMLEAQEMFRTANKVTRPEKALILGFMAGSRDNPCPHLGNVVTIKLSENQENVLNGNHYVVMIVETHFQMNYSTGEWKRIRKYRRLEDVQQS